MTYKHCCLSYISLTRLQSWKTVCGCGHKYNVMGHQDDSSAAAAANVLVLLQLMPGNTVCFTDLQ